MSKKSEDEFYQGCAAVFILVIVLIISINSCINGCESGYTTQSANDRSSSYDANDPISWREEEKKMEDQIPGLRNAKYSCKRCGMKSDRELNDPDGIWGRNGVCAYCIEYLKSKQR